MPGVVRFVSYISCNFAQYKLQNVFFVMSILDERLSFITRNKCFLSLGPCMQTEMVKRQLRGVEAGFSCLSSSFTPHPFLMNGLSPFLSTANRKQDRSERGMAASPSLPLCPSLSLSLSFSPKAYGPLWGTATEACRCLPLLRQQVSFSLQLMSHK